MMEMVIICVLIAAACVIAVVVFGRTVVRNTDLMDKGLVGRGNRAGEANSQDDAQEEVDRLASGHGMAMLPPSTVSQVKPPAMLTRTSTAPNFARTSAITFSNPQAGLYDIWIGAYNGGRGIPGQLVITER